MSWLASGLTQSVTGKISQLGGQIKDILTEGTEEVYDPNNELKVLNDKLKENEKHIEMLKLECSRWQDESNELNVKCQSYEAQIEQRQNEYRQQIIVKDNLIADLRNQINSFESTKNDDFSSVYQKSAFMEEYEEVMPSSDLNDYIQLQKEIKRLKDDNIHLSNENKELLTKLKQQSLLLDKIDTFDQNLNEFQIKQQNYEQIIDNLNQEIFNLKNRLETDKDKHESEIIDIQNSYMAKFNLQLNDKQIEIDQLKLELNEKKASTTEVNISLNEDQNDELIKKYTIEIEQLKSQIDLFQNELEQANSLILKLKKNDSSPNKNDQLKDENLELKKKLDNNEKLIDSLQLELKQSQQMSQQEKLIQLQEQKLDKQELAKLKNENTELKIKLDEKLSEITLLGEQINDLNKNLNHLKTNDRNLFDEFKLKTENFLNELDQSNQEISNLRIENENLNEQRKQFEFVLDEKTRENSKLKLDIQNNIQHITTQSKLIEKLQINDLEKYNKEIQTDELNNENDNEHSNELSLLKNQYNQIYSYLEQKNQESLSYYNEIQRLNLVISDLNRELLNVKSMNDNLHEQYDNLLKGFQLEQKMVDDLNQQTSELNNTLLSIQADADQQKSNRENKINEKDEDLKLIKELNDKIDELKQQKDNLEFELKDKSECLLNEEQRNIKLSKELERLKEHLFEMSDNYTREAIQAEEIEKQLRLALNDAQNKLQQQDEIVESSSKELGVKLDQFIQLNQELKNENEKLNTKLKQTEENLSHQIKVTKNLELVLERLQNEKDAQHTLELSKYQQTIKEQAIKMNNLQKEGEKYRLEIDDLKFKLESISRLECELNDRNEEMKKMYAQISTKDVLVESLERRVNEIQKVNESYIEKEMIKNLVIGYVKVNQVQEKKQVLKLIATMLNFSQQELDLIENVGESKWFGLLGKQSTSPSKTLNKQGYDGLNKSFTELLIQYVDRESKPKPNLQFDLNKKTDNPLNDKSTNLVSSESAIKFFNSSLLNSNVNSSDLNLVNRGNNSALSINNNNNNNNSVNNTNINASSTSQSVNNPMSGLSSPAVANSFLEQILK